MANRKRITTIGRAESVELPDFLTVPLKAKIDTGADISSIWATNIHVKEDKLCFSLLGKSHPAYTGKVITIAGKGYSQTRVANSFGDKEVRYVVKMRIKLADRLVRTSLTLADRSRKTYPLLIGRKLLANKFVVDVTTGDPLREVEKVKRNKMRLELNKHSGNLGE